MKKVLLTFCFFGLVGLVARAQDTQKPVVADLTVVQKATLEMAEYYGLYETQVAQAKQIQQTKFNNLAEIERFKNTNLKEYVERKLGILEAAESEIYQVLDENQREKFAERIRNIENKRLVKASDMRKSQLSETAQLEEWAKFDF